MRETNVETTPVISNLEVATQGSFTPSGGRSLGSRPSFSENEGRILGSGNNIREHYMATARRRLEQGQDTIPVIEEYENIPTVDATVIHHINSDPELRDLRRSVLSSITNGQFSEETIKMVINRIPSDLRTVIIETLNRTPTLDNYLPIANIALLGGIGLENTQQMTQNVLNAILGATVELPVNPMDIIEKAGVDAKTEIENSVNNGIMNNQNSNDATEITADNILRRIFWGNVWRRSLTVLGTLGGAYFGSPYLGPIIGILGRTVGTNVAGNDHARGGRDSGAETSIGDVADSFDKAIRMFFRYLAGG